MTIKVDPMKVAHGPITIINHPYSKRRRESIRHTGLSVPGYGGGVRIPLQVIFIMLKTPHKRHY